MQASSLLKTVTTNHIHAGKLHSQFGLLHTSLGMFNEAIQNFEKALPLVRSGVRSANSVQVEASLLQNIGAAYNELGRYFDAVIYHREAAALHGKTLLIPVPNQLYCATLKNWEWSWRRWYRVWWSFLNVN